MVPRLPMMGYKFVLPDHTVRAARTPTSHTGAIVIRKGRKVSLAECEPLSKAWKTRTVPMSRRTPLTTTTDLRRAIPTGCPATPHGDKTRERQVLVGRRRGHGAIPAWEHTNGRAGRDATFETGWNPFWQEAVPVTGGWVRERSIRSIGSPPSGPPHARARPLVGREALPLVAHERGPRPPIAVDARRGKQGARPPVGLTGEPGGGAGWRGRSRRGGGTAHS